MRPPNERIPMLKFLIPILLVCFLAVSAHACPYCADTIHNTDTQAASSLGGAMNLSIYCMFMGLLVAMGIVVRVIVKGIQQK